LFNAGTLQFVLTISGPVPIVLGGQLH